MLSERELKRTQLEQLEIFKLLLKQKHYGRDHSSFPEVLRWLRTFPQSIKSGEREGVRRIICSAFGITQEDLDKEIVGAPTNGNGKLNTPLEAQRLETELDSLLPNRGLLRKYVEYTSHSEAPLAYHVFSFLCGVGNIVNRRVFFNMGYYRLYPTLGVIILGPSGVKKTSACNIIVDILQQLGLGKIYSEKLTPEALIDAMKGENATGLVYAPEMSVFLNKQKYNEGLVQLITRFMDCPDVWESGTIGRGKSVLHNIAISSLMCSTPDWFVTSIPQDSFGGGFIARNLLVVQENSARCEPIPDPGDSSKRQFISDHLAGLHAFEGEMILDRIARERYFDWYQTAHQDEMKHPEHELLATYHNRKPDHIKRIAMCLHLIDCANLAICDVCFLRAIKLLDWLEQFLPTLLTQMFKSQVGEAHEQVLRFIRMEVKMTHSDLVRKMSNKMSAADLKTVITSLKEARLILEHVDNVGHYYTILEE